MLLDDIPLYHKVKIKCLKNDKNIRKRLNDLGFIEGEEIYPVLFGMFHTIKAFRISGTTIAIRKKESMNILVEENDV